MKKIPGADQSHHQCVKCAEEECWPTLTCHVRAQHQDMEHSHIFSTGETKIKNIRSLNNTVQAGFTEFVTNLEFYVSPFHNCFDIYINDIN